MRFGGPGKTVERETLPKSQPIKAGRKYKTFFDLFLFAKSLWEMSWLDSSYLDKTTAHFSFTTTPQHERWKLSYKKYFFCSSLEISNVPMVSKLFALIISFHSHLTELQSTLSLKIILQPFQGLPNPGDKRLFTATGLSFDIIEL